MNETLAAEVVRVNRGIDRILVQSTLGAEAPVRLHSRDTDSGGAPEFHKDFVKWIGAICQCGRGPVCAVGCRAERPGEHLDLCEPGCPSNSRFMASFHRNSPTRFKRALRQVRKHNPQAHDLLYLILVLHMTPQGAMQKLNEDYHSRGQEKLTTFGFGVLWASGGSMLASAY